MNDLIEKLSNLRSQFNLFDEDERDAYHVLSDAIKVISAIKSLEQPDLDEWCTDCKEYDQERHCCPRWNRVIRQTLKDAQPEPCEDAVSRNAIIQKLNTMDRYVSEELVLCDTDKKFPKNEVFIVDDVYEEIVENLPSAQPEQYHDPFGNPIYVYVRVDDKTVAIKADDLQKALDYVTEHGEEVTIEGRRIDDLQ